VAYLYRVNISIAGQFMAREFHLSNAQLGRVFSAFVLGYALFQAPGGWLADKLAPRAVLTMAAIRWASLLTQRYTACRLTPRKTAASRPRMGSSFTTAPNVAP
jgi:nitrate/nitrite transporter NarK